MLRIVDERTAAIRAQPHLHLVRRCRLERPDQRARIGVPDVDAAFAVPFRRAARRQGPAIAREGGAGLVSARKRADGAALYAVEDLDGLARHRDQAPSGGNRDAAFPFRKDEHPRGAAEALHGEPFGHAPGHPGCQLVSARREGERADALVPTRIRSRAVPSLTSLILITPSSDPVARRKLPVSADPSNARAVIVVACSMRSPTRVPLSPSTICAAPAASLKATRPPSGLIAAHWTPSYLPWSSAPGNCQTFRNRPSSCRWRRTRNALPHWAPDGYPRHRCRSGRARIRPHRSLRAS